MKKKYWFFKIICCSLLLLLFSCGKDEGNDPVAENPTNLTASIDVATDGSGLVTVMPSATNANRFEIRFDPNAPLATISVGQSASYTYSDSGQYTITITAYGEGSGNVVIAEVVTVEVEKTIATNFTTLVWADEFDATGAPNPANWTYDLGAGGWGNEELQSYTNDPSNVVVENGMLKITAKKEESSGDGVYYFDDIQVLNASDEVQFEVENFETGGPTFEDFGGAFSVTANNPDASGINTSTQVGQLTKTMGSEVWAGSFFRLDSGLDVPNNPKMRLKVWSPAANVIVKLKIEDDTDNTKAAEVDVLTTVAGQWEELVFDFSSASTEFTYDRVVLFFDFGNPGTAGSGYSSARIKSEGLQEFTYGRVETRAKLPTGGGTWPAIWLLGADYHTNPWPGCGEIDVMEHVGNQQNFIFGTTHDPNNFGGNGRSGSTFVNGVSDDFHVYEMEWTETEIKFAVDGEVFHTVTNNGSLPFNSDFFFIMNVAMGGTFGGEIDANFQASSMEVDYIRMYQ